MSSSLKRCLSKYVLFFIDIKVNSNSVSWWLSNYWLYVCSISKVYFIYVRILQLIMLLQIICRWDKRIFRCFVYLRYFVWLYLIQIYGNYILSNTKRVNWYQMTSHKLAVIQKKCLIFHIYFSWVIVLISDKYEYLCFLLFLIISFSNFLCDT